MNNTEARRMCVSLYFEQLSNQFYGLEIAATTTNSN